MTPWDGIEEFVAVAEAGSFVGAARALKSSNAHISRAVARLEGKVGSRLFNRTTRSLSLTHAGRAFLEPCRRMIQDRDDALGTITTEGTPQGELRITCSAALGHKYVVPIVQKYIQKNENLSIWIELTNRLVDLVGEGFDLAIRTGHLPDSRLVATRIASRSIYTCASRAYLDLHGRPTKIGQLEDHHCLIGTSSVWHFKTGSEVFDFKPKGKWRCNSGDGVLHAAISDMGICQLPEHYIEQSLHSGKLEVLLDDHRVEDEAVWAVYPHRKHLLPRVKGLVDLLRTDLPHSLKNNAFAP